MYLHASADGVDPKVARAYDAKFRPSARYLATLPDIMDAAHDAIQGAHVPIQQVGVSNFRLPLKFRTKTGEILTLETSVTGTVSLEAELKGINMSRIVRSFYDHKGEVFTGESVGRILRSYLRRVESKDARLKLSFSYPILQRSLRSGSKGYQFYKVAFEGVRDPGGRLPALRPFRLRLLLGLPLFGRARRARPRHARGLRACPIRRGARRG